VTHPCPIPLPRYSPEQLSTLDHIGRAWERGYIDFEEATQLRDQIRAGEITEVLSYLAAARVRRAA
jgi:sulfite reductase beta subunit-like hemoprotein